MALTPEDVVGKNFQPTKFREGYDQDEVDDFLDEVVTELRRLNSENDDLRETLAAAEQRVAELSGGDPAAGAGPAVDPTAVDREPAPEVADLPALERSDPASAAPSPVVVDDVPAQPAPQVVPVAPSSGPTEAAGMLALAQRLHDEHVRSGEEQRDRLVGDAEAQRDRLVGEAREHATQIVSDAEEKQRETLGSLERERSLLERKIDELRGFERDYRSRLKSYLQSQLRDLDGTSAVVPGADSSDLAGGRS